MDYPSTSFVQNYDTILDSINSEFEIHTRLEEDIKKELDQNIISNLSQNKIIDKICHVNIKVFMDLCELYTIYSELPQVVFDKLKKSEQCAFYLIEIFISKLVLEKLLLTKWHLNVSIMCENFSLNHTVPMGKNSPMMVVLPVPDSIVNCLAEVQVVSCTSNNVQVISLHSQTIDVSYHFSKSKPWQSKLNGILQLSKSKMGENLLQNNISASFEVSFSGPIQKFVEAFLHNCYHRLDIEQFSQLNDSMSTLSIKFYTLKSKHFLSLNRQSGKIRIDSNFRELPLLKKYFLMALHDPEAKYCKDYLKEHMDKLMNIYRNSYAKCPEEIGSIEAVEIRKLLDGLPY